MDDGFNGDSQALARDGHAHCGIEMDWLIFSRLIGSLFGESNDRLLDWLVDWMPVTLHQVIPWDERQERIRTCQSLILGVGALTLTLLERGGEKKGGGGVF